MRLLPVRLPPLVLFVLTGLLSCGHALPDHATVRRVIDGDTVELADGRLVRYIGVDAPEVRRRQDGHWVIDPEPLGQATAEFNRRLVEGQPVRLEYDVQTHDRYGRLLAYVYVEPHGQGPWYPRSRPGWGDIPPTRTSRHDRGGPRQRTVAWPDGGVGEVMVNAELLRMGFARPLTIPPNLKYVDRFRALTEEARQERRGLWAEEERSGAGGIRAFPGRAGRRS